jgi:hypothetical protein
MAVLVRRYVKQVEEFHRRFTLPQEDRMQITDAPHAGGYRWFRSENIIPIEYFKRTEIRATAPTKRAG